MLTEQDKPTKGELLDRIREFFYWDYENGGVYEYDFENLIDEAKQEFPTMKQAREIYNNQIPNPLVTPSSEIYVDLAEKWFKRWFGGQP